jgi:small subunit ribosomal protein S6
MFIIRPDLEEEKNKLFNQLNDDIVKNQGKINDSKVWLEKRRLAYRIKKYDEGLYYLIHFSVTPEAISRLKQVWRINDNILRFLILRLG